MHFVAHGKCTDEISFDTLIGTVYVVRVPDNVSSITKSVLENLSLPKEATRLLFRTSNSYLWESKVKKFKSDFVALTPEAAQWIVDRGIILVGIDYMSIQRFDDGPETHQILLGADVVVVEGLNLSNVSEGKYELICLPIKLENIEGAPARVLLKT